MVHFRNLMLQNCRNALLDSLLTTYLVQYALEISSPKSTPKAFRSNACHETFAVWLSGGGVSHKTSERQNIVPPPPPQSSKPRKHK
eukprot:669931-Amphidinium_carterae.1